MTQEETQTIETLQARVAAADSAERLRLQPQVARVVATLKAKGTRVPCRLRQLDMTLRDEALDDMFDNMPV